jgi:hypothetical protein
MPSPRAPARQMASMASSMGMGMGMPGMPAMGMAGAAAGARGMPGSGSGGPAAGPGDDGSGQMGLAMGMAGAPGMPGMAAMPGMPAMGMPGFDPSTVGAMMAAAGPGMGAAAGGGAAAAASALAAAKAAWKLFVGQISYDLGEEQLTAFFGQFGAILELALPRTEGRSRGYAFVTYSSRAEAAAAIERANGAVIPSDPRARPLTVRWADNKGR